jgi:phosphoribosylformylglycinamidine cyclo-ligase
MVDRYANMGVDVSEADRGIARIVEQIKTTWPAQGLGAVKLDIGYFANVIDFGGIGLASTTDGVGSKTMIADLMGKWDTIGIDCVAMVANDLICVGATPVSMVDYIGIEYVDQDVLGEIAIGLAEGARQAGMSITGGEVSQLPDMLQGFDLVGTAFGRVPLDRIIDGSAVKPGDVIIGIESNGVHSNGLTFARKSLLEEAFYDPDQPRDELAGLSIGQELLRPTHIYVKEILALLDAVPVHALINITGDGLINLNRVRADGVGFAISWLLPRPPIFDFIQRVGRATDAEMWTTFNMGIGFCVIVAPNDVDQTLAILADHDRFSQAIGTVVTDDTKSVHIQPYRLISMDKHFISPYRT